MKSIPEWNFRRLDGGGDRGGSSGGGGRTGFRYIRRKSRSVRDGDSRSEEGWTSAGFRQYVENLFKRYERLSGIEITVAGRRETLRSMVYTPYKFISSDSRSFLGRLRKDLGLPGTATVAEVQSALRNPENRAKLDALLADPQQAHREFGASWCESTAGTI